MKSQVWGGKSQIMNFTNHACPYVHANFVKELIKILKIFVDAKFKGYIGILIFGFLRDRQACKRYDLANAKNVT